MDSLSLLPELSLLPADKTGKRSSREAIEDLLANDVVLFASELAVAVSVGMWGIWDRVNVPDELSRAYAMQYPGLADDCSLLEQWRELQERGAESAAGFVSGLKGKLAELKASELLEANGFTDVSLAASPTQEAWDISAITEAGDQAFFQVKTGGADFAASVAEDLQQAANVDFLVGSELFDQLSQRNPEFADRLTDIGSDYELVEGLEDGLGTLSENYGVDIPDTIGEIVPYVGSIVIGLALIRSVLKSERDFSDADRTSKNKIHVVRTLTLISRFGISAVLATVGGIVGAEAGSIVPGVGNLIGGLGGGVSGGVMGWKLNRRLQPRMLDLALSITGLTEDDLFYFKNKSRLDQLALSFRDTANELGEMSFG